MEEIESSPSASWLSVTTPSTLEVPLRTATAFLEAEATMAIGFGEAEAEKDKYGRAVVALSERPWKEEVNGSDDEKVAVEMVGLKEIGRREWWGVEERIACAAMTASAACIV